MAIDWSCESMKDNYQGLFNELGFLWKVESDFCGMCGMTTKYTTVSETGVRIQLWKYLGCDCPGKTFPDPNFLFVCWGKTRNPYKDWASFVAAIKLTHKQITEPAEPPKPAAPAETAAGAFFKALLAAKAAPPAAGGAKERLPTKEWPALGAK